MWKDTQYSCILCFNPICDACAEASKSDENGDDEDNYRDEKCPRDECKKDDNMLSSVVVDKKSFNPFFFPRKKKKGESVKLTSENVNQNTVQEEPAKLANYDGHETSSNIDEAREKVRSTAPNTAAILPNLKEDLIDLLKRKNKPFLAIPKGFQ